MGTTRRKFGIELEFECAWKELRKSASRIINKVYGPKKYYAREATFESDTRLDKWHIKQDGGYDIAELTTPVSYKKDLIKIKRVVKGLRQEQLNPSDNCGFHVHLHIPDINQYHFLAGWMLCEKAILSCFPIDRRKSSYCEKIIEYPQQSKTLVANILEDKLNQSDHSHAISFCSYEERQTVEIRIAEGTDNEDFVVSWIEFLLCLTDHIKTINPCLISNNKCNSVLFDDLIDELHLTKSTREYMMKRYERYSKLPYWTH